MKTLTAANVLILFASALCLAGAVVSDLRAQDARHKAELAAARAAECPRCRCREPGVPFNLRNGVLPSPKRRGIGELGPERD